MQKLSVEEQLAVIRRGASEIISEAELKQKLQASIRENRPLKIKAGFDPTAPDLHLGHTVLLRKLKVFQELGHRVFFLIGDFTGRIGDPSGRSQIRKQLSAEEVKNNAETYKKQVSKLLDLDKLEVVTNSAWFDNMPVIELMRLTQHITVPQLLAREDFKKRLERKDKVSLVEFMYPVLQGYDSVKLEADVELGGTDQVFNLLVGRDIQKDFGQQPQVVITMPLLEGTDGAQKMSKSFGNYVGINDPPSEMFGKLMSIPDGLMAKYYTLLTDEDLSGLEAMHPKEAKLKLAGIITAQYHSREAAEKARIEFQRVFGNKQAPQEMPEYRLSTPSPVSAVMLEGGLVKSGNEARRLVRQGAVFFNETRVESEDFMLDKPGILKAGARRYLKVLI